MSKRVSTKNEAPPVTAAMGGVFSFSLREQFEACSDEALWMDSAFAQD
jgi:hypothetical protein